MLNSDVIETLAEAAQGSNVVTGPVTHVVPSGQARTREIGLYVVAGTYALWRVVVDGDHVVLRRLFRADTITRSLPEWRDDLAFGRVQEVG